MCACATKRLSMQGLARLLRNAGKEFGHNANESTSIWGGKSIRGFVQIGTRLEEKGDGMSLVELSISAMSYYRTQMPSKSKALVLTIISGNHF